MSLGPNTRIAGDLRSRCDREAQLPSGAVAGRVEDTPIERSERPEPVLNGLVSFGSLA
ncbi:MAG: hypothetical protein ACRDI2_11030 [Chloroflexota bacterium]